MSPRSIQASYILCLLGFVGVAGLHRFYLGKWVTGLLWLATGGLFFIGTIYDLLTLPGQVEEANRQALGEPAHREPLGTATP